MFTVLPAVDVALGRAVRLTQGSIDGETTYGAPLDIALEWQGDGASWVHLVDLDAAFGRGSNTELLGGVIGELDIDVELAGGIDDDTSLNHALSTGCSRAVLSSVAVSTREWCCDVIATYGERLAVSLDVLAVDSTSGDTRYTLAPRGAPHRGGGDLFEIVEQLDRAGCERYVVTDVTRDGTLHGPNMELYRVLADLTMTPIVASGGVSSLADLTELARRAGKRPTVEGAIVGKALYAGRFTLGEALAATR